MTFRVAVVAAACEFPEGRCPQELWSTVLHGRRCFRQLPPERIALDEYLAVEAGPDGLYAVEAAILEGYNFDRERFRVPKSSFDGTDMSHWLALDVATRALSSLNADGLAVERDTTAVIVANTLTGEFSRANLMRYRWPYVERVVRSLTSSRLADTEINSFIKELEGAYKAPFPEPDEDSLSGGLSNTIAGRIANHHGLRGGAYTVDGACASSLVAVVNAFERLRMGDVGCVVVGAVDLSLDPFELVGFARNGALARDLMRVFDEQSDGFWPGEGCGFLVLANEAVVAKRGWPVLAWIRGAAMSTDGEGALTRPTVEGQILAAQRAWQRAGLDPVNADYFEAHGTGTPTGDPIELTGLAGLVGRVPPRTPIPVGSIKANIGHTKAAAGMAGLLKAIAISRERVIPGTAGCFRPHPVLQSHVGARVNVLGQATRISHDRPATIGVNSFGFGGVNCHVVVQGTTAEPVGNPQFDLPDPRWSELASEIFTIQDSSRTAIAAQLQQVERRARTLSRAQLVDLAFNLTMSDEPSWRVCLTASTPEELAVSAADARNSLESHSDVTRYIGKSFCWSAPVDRLPQIALLFPGQGLPLQVRPAPWSHRFPQLSDVAARIERLANSGDLSDTAIVQPLLAEVALAALAFLNEFDVNPVVVMGHSFGELPALHAAGCITADCLRDLAVARGRCMRDDAPTGAMLAVHASRDVALSLAKAYELDLACENGPNRHVLAGDSVQITAAAAACAARSLSADLLPSARAFHSRHMAGARDSFAKHLSKIIWQPARLTMISSITGQVIEANEPLSDLLARQFVSPVKFTDAIDALPDVDLVIEMGSTPALSALIEAAYPGRVTCLQMFDQSVSSALLTLGTVWTLGGKINLQPLYARRQIRECHLDDEPEFLSNPCGVSDGRHIYSNPVHAAVLPPQSADSISAEVRSDERALEALRCVLSEITGLARSGMDGGLHLLSDLHLNSIRARHAIALAARRIGLAKMPFDLARLANASVEEVAVYLEAMRGEVGDDHDRLPPSIAPWLRLLTHAWMDVDAPPAPREQWSRAVSLDDALAPLDSASRTLLNLAEPKDSHCLIVVLPALKSAAVGHALLRSVQTLTSQPGVHGIIVLQGSQMANAFLRSVSAELPHCRFCVVEYEELVPATLSAAIAEYERSDRGYGEARLRRTSYQRRVTSLAILPRLARRWTPTEHGVVLVTGGARGIGAATALALAKRYACRLAIVGRSDIDAPEISNTISSLRDAGSDAQYFRADLTDFEAAKSTISSIESSMGPLTSIFHAAGINQPTSIAALGRDVIDATIASKVASLENLLQCAKVTQLDLVVGYGSIIGEFGLAGEAHYALANEWLNEVLMRFSEVARDCTVVPICWSAWRETGMAPRLEGVLAALEHSGTRALDSGEALEALFRILESPPREAVIVCGRYGRSVDPNSDWPMLQAHRYLECPRVFYPGIELVADAQLSSDVDRYLQDHAPFGVPVFPLVCALEAMISAAQCLCRSSHLPTITALATGPAISCALGQRIVLRTSALVQDDGRSVFAEIRSDTTGFEVVHFSASISWAGTTISPWPALVANCEESDAGKLLYQGICFHGPRFHRLGNVTALSATHCSVRTKVGARADWYGPLLPQGFFAGDPGVRDAVLHALQLCFPHQMMLPTAVGKIHFGRLDSDTEYIIRARQLVSEKRRVVFDVQVCDFAGKVVEAWSGLELVQAPASVLRKDREFPLPPVLLQSLVARIATDVLEANEVCAGMVFVDPGETGSGLALERALGRKVTVNRDMNGAITINNVNVSTSHAAGISIALARNEGPVAIDLQFAADIEVDEWRLMLGEERMHFAMELSEQDAVPLQQALLTAWTASECLIKLGRSDWPLSSALRWREETAQIGPLHVFDCGSLRLAVASLAISGVTARASCAIALEHRSLSHEDIDAPIIASNGFSNDPPHV